MERNTGKKADVPGKKGVVPVQPRKAENLDEFVKRILVRNS
jgi:hypothetical protein